MIAVFSTIDMVLGLYTWIIIASAIFSWLYAFNVVNSNNRFVGMIGEVLYKATEPALRPIRRGLRAGQGNLHHAQPPGIFHRLDARQGDFRARLPESRVLGDQRRGQRARRIGAKVLAGQQSDCPDPRE